MSTQLQLEITDQIDSPLYQDVLSWCQIKQYIQ